MGKMFSRRVMLYVCALTLFLLFAAGTDKVSAVPPLPSSGTIYLYGEGEHGEASVLNQELELWRRLYHEDGMRHLFIEYPYYTAEFLNLWMKAEDDEILNALYDDWVGTFANVPSQKEFYKRIKAECPETVFHGTDIGHQYHTTGTRYLHYLKVNGLKDSTEYNFAVANMEQGRKYYESRDDEYRENMMVKNFLRALRTLKTKDIMGIYGASHTRLGAIAHGSDSLPCMAAQLYELFGDSLRSEEIFKVPVPIRTDTLTVNGKEYEASYFGHHDWATASELFSRIKFWRLEDAYNDFKDMPKSGQVLPYNNYPMPVEDGQVFAVELTKKSGGKVLNYFRSDGREWEGSPSTEEFLMDGTTRVDIFTVNGKQYEASYFGQEDISAWSERFTSRKFWRFEDAYNDFKDMPKSGQVLPYDDYPMDVEEGQVFNVEYTEKGGGTVWKFYRSDGYVRDGIPYTEELE